MWKIQAGYCVESLNSLTQPCIFHKSVLALNKWKAYYHHCVKILSSPSSVIENNINITFVLILFIYSIWFVWLPFLLSNPGWLPTVNSNNLMKQSVKTDVQTYQTTNNYIKIIIVSAKSIIASNSTQHCKRSQLLQTIARHDGTAKSSLKAWRIKPIYDLEE